MPLGRFLKILLSGLFIVAVLFAVVSFIQSSTHIQNYISYKHSANYYFDVTQTFVISIINWFGDLSHDELLTFSTVLIAVFTGSLWWSTHKLFKAGKEQVVVAQAAANAAQSAADTAKETLIVSERPWVAIVSREIDTPLTFVPDGARVGLKIRLKNTGRTPATNIQISARAYSLMHYAERPDFGTADPQKISEATDEAMLSDPHVNYMQLSEATRREERPHRFYDFGVVIFPGDTIERKISVTVPQVQIERALQPPMIPLSPIIIIVCIDYRFALDRRSHQTGCILHLKKKRKKTNIKGRFQFAIYGDQGDIAAADLVLSDYGGGSFYAD